MHRKLLLLVLLPLHLSAQTARDSIVNVTATRTTRVAPDRATFYLIVEGTAETAADAITRVDTKVKAVSDALKALGSRVTIESPVAYGVGPTPAPNGFPTGAAPTTNTARSVIRVQTGRPDQVAHVVATGIGAGASGAAAMAFEASTADSVRRARIADALSGAHADAEAIANGLGGRLGSLLGVTLSGTPFTGFPNTSTLSFDNRFVQPSPVPDVAVTTTVSVQYRLIH
jgi:uncharacterized protein YggE